MVEVKRAWPSWPHVPHVSSTLLLSTVVSVGLFAGGVIRNNNDAYSYMVWNLFLAWIPLLLMVWLLHILVRKRWSSWQGIAVSVVWLGFLPNSFYMVTDYIHLADAPRVDILYDAVMLTSFVLNGLILGYLSLYLFHVELRRRLPSLNVRAVITAILLMCSFAIYMGRDLRWNTWDVFLNPAGILFDVSDRFLHPSAYPDMFVTVSTFFVLLGTFYYVMWKALDSVRQGK